MCDDMCGSRCVSVGQWRLGGETPGRGSGSVMRTQGLEEMGIVRRYSLWQACAPCPSLSNVALTALQPENKSQNASEKCTVV